MARLYLSPPYMGGAELEYVQKAFEENWIAPLGPNVDAFEKEMKERIGCSEALAVASGTAAIHLALRSLGVGKGDLVFCTSMTFIGSMTPVLYQGASPVFIDSEPGSWNMSPVALRRAFEWAAAKGKMPKAVIIVDLFGHPADYASLLPICEEYGVPVIEDAAEALGAEYQIRPCGKDEPCPEAPSCGYYKPCGTFGAVNVLSFNGNKIITTSGGGMLLTEDKSARDKMLFWATQARDKAMHYEHTEYGYNYRMSNIVAGVGRGQMRLLDKKLQIRREIYERYIAMLEGTEYHVKLDMPYAKPNHWLTVASIDGADIYMVEKVVAFMNAHDIETRPAWKPLHMQPVFVEAPAFSELTTGIEPDTDIYAFTCAKLFDKGICLPSGDAMTIGQQDTVCRLLKEALAF